MNPERPAPRPGELFFGFFGSRGVALICWKSKRQEARTESGRTMIDSYAVFVSREELAQAGREDLIRQLEKATAR